MCSKTEESVRKKSIIALAMFAFVQFTGPAALAALGNPLGYWPMADKGGEGFVDGSRTYTLATDGDVVVEANERFGSCARFGGRLVFSENLIEALNRTETLTVACWLFPERSARDATWQPFLRIWNPGLRQQMNMDLRWNGIVLKHYASGQYETRSHKPHGTLEPYRWTHVVVTWDDNTARFWFNGHDVGTKTLAGLEPGMRGSITLGSKEWGGLMAHLRIYDRTLSEDEIAELIALNRPKDLPGENDPVPNCPGETLGEKKRETDYTIRELKTYFPSLEQWPDWKAMTALDPTFAKKRFKAPPKPYVHPRVLFNAEDLPRIRERLSQTVIGNKMMQSVRGRCLQLNANPRHWEAIPYGKVRKSDLRAEYLRQGIDIGPGRSGYHGPWLGGALDALAEGTVPPLLEDVWQEHIGAPRHYLVNQMAYEAFRCLIDEDDAGLRRVGKALGTICRRFIKDPRVQELSKGTEWQPIYQFIHSQAIGLTYDFAYNHMSKRDRDDTRKFIAMVTANKTILPTQHLPAFPANTTNWLIIHANMMPMLLAIEGEDGYDHLAYQRIVEAMKKWVYVTCGPLGAPFEGFNKSGYAPYWLPYLAKRGVPLCGTTYSKNVARKYSLHMMMPWGGAFAYETEIGPVNPGMVYFKYAHPTDAVIDMLYGYTVKDAIRDDGAYPWPNIRTTYPPHWGELLVADDPAGVMDGTYDWDAAFNRTMAHLKESGEPLSYYSDYRGVMTARSAWDRDAVFFYMEPRNVPGGHTHASRNEFLVAGLGRKWSERPKSVEAGSNWHSVILIDGKGQGIGGKCPAGRTVAVVDEPQATFITGDAKWAYSHVMCKVDGGQPIDVTPNQSRVNPSPLPWMDQPWSFLPQWFTGGKPSRKNRTGHGHWREYNPVEYAFRTGGLVRGRYPYVLVVDDLRKDDQAHTYTWQMQLAQDLAVEKKLNADGSLDLTLVEVGDRRCLVRCVEAGGKALDRFTADASGHDPHEHVDRYKKPQSNNRLTVNSQSRVGDFKTLIFPYRFGMPEPETAFNGDRSRMIVTIGEQKDIYTFKKDENGRTHVSMMRNGEMIF